MDYDDLVAVNTRAIQELDEQQQSQKNKLKTLEQENKELREQNEVIREQNEFIKKQNEVIKEQSELIKVELCKKDNSYGCCG